MRKKKQREDLIHEGTRRKTATEPSKATMKKKTQEKLEPRMDTCLRADTYAQADGFTRILKRCLAPFSPFGKGGKRGISEIANPSTGSGQAYMNYTNKTFKNTLSADYADFH